MKMFSSTIKDVKIASINRKFLTHPKYINSKEHLAGLFMIDNPKGLKFTTPTGVGLFVHTLKDIDNLLKIILDALQFANILSDDKIVKSLIVELYSDDLERGAREDMHIEIIELNQAQLLNIKMGFKKLLGLKIK